MKKVGTLLVALVLVGFIFMGCAYAEECSHQNTRVFPYVYEVDVKDSNEVCYKEVQYFITLCEECDEIVNQTQSEEIPKEHQYENEGEACLRCGHTEYTWNWRRDLIAFAVIVLFLCAICLGVLG